MLLNTGLAKLGTLSRRAKSGTSMAYVGHHQQKHVSRSIGTVKTHTQYKR
jgi:hypothetical protein